MLSHINQQHVRGCCNFNVLNNSNDLFRAYSESEHLSSIIVKKTGLKLAKMTVYHLLTLSAIFRVEGLVQAVFFLKNAFVCRLSATFLAFFGASFPLSHIIRTR